MKRLPSFLLTACGVLIVLCTIGAKPAEALDYYSAAGYWGNSVDLWSVSQLDYNDCANGNYCDAYVQGWEYVDGTYTGWSDDTEFSAGVSMSDSANPGSEYSIVGLHYFQNSITNNWDYFGYDVGSVTVPVPQPPPAPGLSSVSPTIGIANTSGFATLYGWNLGGSGPGDTSVYLNGWMQLTYVSDGQINFYYSSIPAGVYSITVSTSGGTSNSVQFTVVTADPTPVISSLSPTSWSYSQNNALTISGSGFGTAPSVKIVYPDAVTEWASVSAAADTLLYATAYHHSTASGQISVTVISNGHAGVGFVGSNQNYATTYASVLIPQPQTITFAAIGSVNLGAAPFAVSATASSGLPVTVTSGSQAVCTVAGLTVTILSAGSCSLTASQAGNSAYLVATPVTQSFTVYSPGFTLSVSPSATISVMQGGMAQFTVSYTPVHGYAGSPTLSLASAPQGVGVLFDANGWSGTTQNVIVNTTVLSALAAGQVISITATDPSATPSSVSITIVLNISSGTSITVNPTVYYTNAAPATHAPRNIVLSAIPNGGSGVYSYSFTVNGAATNTGSTPYLSLPLGTVSSASVTVTDTQGTAPQATATIAIPSVTPSLSDADLQVAMLNRVATLNPSGTNSWGSQFQARSGLLAANYSVAQTQATQFQGEMAASIRPSATFQAYARQAYTSTGIAAKYAAQMQHTAFPVAQEEVIYDGDIWDDWGPTLGFGTIPSLAIPILVDSDIYIDGSGNVTAFGDAAVGINASPENGGTTCVTARVTGPGGYFGVASGCAPSSGIQVNLTGLPAATVSGVYTIWAHGSFYVNQGSGVLQGVADSVVSETWSPAAPCAGLQPPAITNLFINNGPMTQLAAGSSGTMLVMGSCLDQSQVSVSGGSVSTPSSGALIYYDGAQYDISQQFTVATGANPGDQTLTVTGPTGLADNTGVEITPSSTPYIDGVYPSVWPAGTTNQVTITGTGFGCSPTTTAQPCQNGVLQISQAGSYVSFSVTSWTDTAVIGTATVSASEPGETLSLSMAGAGYGLGFAQASSQGAESNSATVQATGAATPFITFTRDGNAVNGGALQRVVVGQQINLVATVNNLPSGATVTNQAWTIQPDGSPVGGFPGPNPIASGGPLPLVTNQPATTFYWTAPTTGAAFRAIFTATVSGIGPVYGTVIFAVAGPKRISIQATPGVVGIFLPPYSFMNLGCPPSPTVLYQSVCSGTYTIGSTFNNVASGMSFQVNESDPSGFPGTVSFVQLITNYNQPSSFNNGSSNACTVAPAVLLAGVLDKVYPYASSSTTTDNPGVGLPSTGFVDEGYVFAATMYALWTPKIQGAVQGAIPVPLGSATWDYASEAASNGTGGLWTLKNNSVLLNSRGRPNAPGTPLVAYAGALPSWLKNLSGNGVVTCQ